LLSRNRFRLKIAIFACTLLAVFLVGLQGSPFGERDIPFGDLSYSALNGTACLIPNLLHSSLRFPQVSYPPCAPTLPGFEAALHGSRLKIVGCSGKTAVLSDITNYQYVEDHDNIDWTLAQFVQVKCTEAGLWSNEEHVHLNFRTVIPPDALPRSSNDTEAAWSVNMVTVFMDALSTSRFEHYFPETMEFLDSADFARVYQTFSFPGHITLGDGSLASQVPLFTGFKLEDDELPDRFLSSKNGLHVDDWPFIMKECKAAGYRTFFGEPECRGTWNLNLNGFAHPPSDFDLRQPFCQLPGYLPHFSGRRCVSQGDDLSSLQYDILWDWLNAHNYANIPVWASLNTLEGHEGTGKAVQILDAPTREFFRRLIHRIPRRQHLPIVILTGDHGLRYGEFRQSRQGWTDERLPLLKVLVPRFLLQRYPHLEHNLRANEQSLVTAFNEHRTWQHVLNFARTGSWDFPIKKAPDGFPIHSLLQPPASSSVTCEEVGIPTIWCPCGNQWSDIVFDEDTAQGRKEKRELFVVATQTMMRKIARGKDVCADWSQGAMSKVKFALTPTGDAIYNLVFSIAGREKDHVVEVLVRAPCQVEKCEASGIAQQDWQRAEVLSQKRVTTMTDTVAGRECVDKAFAVTVNEHLCVCK
jgi:hypothetical protein